ncbi:MAG: hypothetical protein GY944_14540 [bacterium]|nr:hypothetical protein [bacterium]
MTEPKILLETRDGVATLTLNAPEKLNALGSQMLDELNDALDRCAADPDLRVVVLTGAGRGFCAGADLTEAGSGDGTADTSAEGRMADLRRRMEESFNPAIKKLANLPVPTIAAVNGIAAGGGYGVALACDLVIAADSAQFVLVFTPQLGLIPDLGASWHAPRALGRARAMAQAFFGERMSAADAVEAGLIWKSVPDESLEKELDAVVKKLRSGPTLAYPAVRKAFDAASTHTLDEHLDLEAVLQPPLLGTDDFIEGVVAFLQKRKPRFNGR